MQPLEVQLGSTMSQGDMAQLRVEIHGAVQGVGFRPFVYRLAGELALAGWVANDTHGVLIAVEGPPDQLRCFLARLPLEAPPRALILSCEATWQPTEGYTAFEIRHSDGYGTRTALILPDIAVCPDCLAEVFDPADRRYGYPFTNCTNCGPRLSIIQDLPYDRPNTTMRHFTMCPACQAEYDDPRNRRFHAQPNACPLCGPHLALWAPGENGAYNVVARQADALRGAAEALQAGKIVAVKGVGGFHLMADAANATTIARLRERKPREEKPFALMARDMVQVRAMCLVDPEEARLLGGPEAPIVLLRRHPDAAVAANVAPGNPYLGVMLAYTPLHHLLVAEVGVPLVATSGNLTDEPICTDEYEAAERLGPVADCFLVHNRPIERHVDDSVAAVMHGQGRVLRRARGYAPLPVMLGHAAPTILAVGAHLKNTIALNVGRNVFVSQHIGDLATPEAITACRRVIADMLRMYDVMPLAIAHDMHPDYVSTRIAREQTHPGMRRIAVQHHHAHLAACLAEHNVDVPALGVTWDGTGYGTDGTIWGGEFLLGDAGAFERVAHLRPFRLPGGEAAVHEPARVALALLADVYGRQAFELDELQSVHCYQPAQRHVLAHMIDSGFQSPITSSMGRLFDGVAALIGLRQRIAFEGQAAMLLEWIADPTVRDAYPIELMDAVLPGGALVLDWRPLIAAVLADLRANTPRETIAARFHNGLVEAVLAIAGRVGVQHVALSGGCFLNRLLLERTAERLSESGYTPLIHRQVPPGDGGISLGQIAVAAASLGRQ